MRRYLVIVLAGLLALGACRRMPLYDKEKSVVLELSLNLDLKLDIDVDIDVDLEYDAAKVELPDHMKVCFYDNGTDKLYHYTFVGPTGGELFVPSNKYKLLVYGIGNEYVQLRGEGDINTIEAFTSEITAVKKAVMRKFVETKALEDPIIYAPDHLLVAREDIEIPEFTGDRQTITIHANASTIVDTYSFEVHSVVGAEYIESAEAFVTNQAISKFIGTGNMNPVPATLWFPIGVDRKRGCLYTVFNTFGKLPGDSESYLHILVRDTGGQEYTITTDITDQFEKTDHHILIEEPVVIPEPEYVSSGGIAPTVDPWDEVIHDVPIG